MYFICYMAKFSNFWMYNIQKLLNLNIIISYQQIYFHYIKHIKINCQYLSPIWLINFVKQLYLWIDWLTEKLIQLCVWVLIQLISICSGYFMKCVSYKDYKIELLKLKQVSESFITNNTANINCGVLKNT